MKKNIILSLCGATALLVCTTSVRAVVESSIRYSTDGVIWTQIDDVDGDGSISTHFSAGGFNLTTVGTLTKPLIGSAASPRLDLSIQGVSGLGPIYIEFSVIDFTPIPTGSYLTHIFSNNESASQTETTRIGGNSLFSGGTSLGALGPLVSGNLFGSGKAPGQSTSYSITILEVLNGGGTTGDIVSTDDKVSVPDGGSTMMLLGSALSFLGLGVFRTRKASAKA
jgi:hypothetical protein